VHVSRGRGRGRGRQADSLLSREPNVGFNPRTLSHNQESDP